MTTGEDHYISHVIHSTDDDERVEIGMNTAWGCAHLIVGESRWVDVGSPCEVFLNAPELRLLARRALELAQEIDS